MPRSDHAGWLARLQRGEPHPVRGQRPRPQARGRRQLPVVAPDCVHLGRPVDRSGGCGEKVRRCDVFGLCTARPLAPRFYCRGPDGAVACPEFEAG